jgi:shikimate kinase
MTREVPSDSTPQSRPDSAPNRVPRSPPNQLSSPAREFALGPSPDEASHKTQAEKPIALVGLRASGKSTIGAILARRLKREFVDLDVEVARLFALDHALDAHAAPHAGEILSRVGEMEFRMLESRAFLAALERREPCVIATGGGIVEYAAHRCWLRTRAWTVWLQIPLEELARRMRADPTPRPPLLGHDPIAEIEVLSARRAPLYAESAHLVLPGASLAPEVLADAILARRAPRPV